MATNKTIAPTNVTVQIPAMTDAPDMAVPANAIDKAIDGINTLNSQKTYKAGDSVHFQQGFSGKATNAKDGYFGCVIVDKPVASDTTATLRSGFTNYGRWASDGQSHTLDNSTAIASAQVTGNAVWFNIPATNISSADTLAWIRLDGWIDFT